MENNKPKSEARLRYEKAEAARVKKHQKELDKHIEVLRRQFSNGH